MAKLNTVVLSVGGGFDPCLIAEIPLTDHPGEEAAAFIHAFRPMIDTWIKLVNYQLMVEFENDKGKKFRFPKFMWDNMTEAGRQEFIRNWGEPRVITAEYTPEPPAKISMWFADKSSDQPLPVVDSPGVSG